MPLLRRLGFVLLALLPAACGSLVETLYEPPAVTLPTDWRAPAPEAAAQAPGPDPWWRAFGDPALDALQAEALARNNDLAAATIAVRRAQLVAGLAADQLLPRLGASLDASTSRELASGADASRSYGTSATIGYELDLWGRLGSERDAARWAALATERDRRATALALTATTAELYWQAIFLEQRLALARASIGYAEQTLALVETRLEAGGASLLERLEAERSLESQRASLSDLEQQRFETESALSILFDGPPRAVTIARRRLPEGPLPAVAAGLPAELLARRPDLASAELRLRQSLAEVDATRASYLPTLSLTGSLGTASVALEDLLSNPIGTLGAGLVLPFLNWNEMQLQTALARSDYQAAVVEFRQTLYQALSEVENALSARRNLMIQAERLQRALEAARGAELLYETRYREGAVDLQSWLNAQEDRRNAEESLLQNRFEQLTNQVLLYQALGGGTGLASEPARMPPLILPTLYAPAD